MALALLLGLLANQASAQAQAPATSASAPAVHAGPPMGHPPTDPRDSAAMPAELRSDHRVVPQLSLPIGKMPPAPAASQASAPPRRKLPPGAIDDSVARCEAKASGPSRQRCLAEAKAARTR